jgi:hypothetical protein
MRAWQIDFTDALWGDRCRKSDHQIDHHVSKIPWVQKDAQLASRRLSGENTTTPNDFVAFVSEPKLLRGLRGSSNERGW